MTWRIETLRAKCLRRLLMRVEYHPRSVKHKARALHDVSHPPGWLKTQFATVRAL